MWKGVKYIVDNFEEIIISVLLPLMVLVIFFGTFGRYSGLFSLPWAEELGRYLMVWVVFLGIGTGAKRNAHFVVDLLPMITPKKYHAIIQVFVTLCTVAFLGVLIYYSSNLVDRVMRMRQVSPSLRMPIWIFYLAIPIGCILMAVRSIQYCVGRVLSERRKGA